MPLTRSVGLAHIELTLEVNARLAKRLGLFRETARRLMKRLQSRRNDDSVAAVARPLPRLTKRDPLTFEDPAIRALAERVNEIDWYQTLDLPGGISTSGYVDHRAQVHLYGLPDDMRGMRALDVATFDGFWAFEMERRGAEVVAVDVARSTDIDIPRRIKERLTPADDKPMGSGFHLARGVMGSRVQRHEVSVYDLSPGLLGEFDLVFMSDLLLHLRDPQRALEMLYIVTKPTGTVLVAEPYDPSLDRFGETPVKMLVGFKNYVWSIPSRAGLKRMMNVAGFDSVTEIASLRLDYRHEYPIEKVVLQGLPQKRHAAGESKLA